MEKELWSSLVMLGQRNCRELKGLWLPLVKLRQRNCGERVMGINGW